MQFLSLSMYVLSWNWVTFHQPFHFTYINIFSPLQRYVKYAIDIASLKNVEPHNMLVRNNFLVVTDRYLALVSEPRQLRQYSD
jgi:hypothetical protein